MMIGTVNYALGLWGKYHVPQNVFLVWKKILSFKVSFEYPSGKIRHNLLSVP